MPIPEPRPAGAPPIGHAARSWRTALAGFRRVAGGYWTGADTRGEALGLLLLLLALNGAEVALFLRFNTWNRDLFDALEQRDADRVLLECGVLALIVLGFCAITSTALLVRRRMALGWRTWLAARLTAGWIAAGEGAAANPDGRIAEDARVATEEAVELFSSLVNALITLVCFVGVLWALSDHPPVQLDGLSILVPGYLVWLAILYVGAGLVATALAGRPLVRTTDHRQAMEADYRAALVQVRDGARRGATEGALLGRLFRHLAAAFNRQSGAFALLEVFVCFFSRFGLGLPFLVATPAYLAGVVTLGWVMQAAQAFQTVAGALSWPIGNMPRLATWRASAERVNALHQAAIGEAAPPMAQPRAEPGAAASSAPV
jgi:putative ATP-binding cassette transporter